METILIIEDNEELCNNVSNLLGSEGFSLVTAGSGEEGLSTSILVAKAATERTGYAVSTYYRQHRRSVSNRDRS